MEGARTACRKSVQIFSRRWSSFSTGGQVPVREVQVALPVVVRDIVAAGPDVIADRAVERVVRRRQIIGSEALLSEQTVDGLGSPGGEELTARVGPAVPLGARDVDGSRRHERDEEVLVHRQTVLTIVVLLEVLAKPVGKRRVDESQNGMFAFNTFGGEEVATTDKAAPVLLSKATADLDVDGFIDAIHLTFSEVISDASVEVSDFTVSAPGVTGLVFSPTAGGDTADDADIYLTFDDGVHHTGITPSVAFTQSGATDLEDQAGANESSAFGEADVRKVSDHPAQGMRSRDLLEPEAQTEARVNDIWHAYQASRFRPTSRFALPCAASTEWGRTSQTGSSRKPTSRGT